MDGAAGRAAARAGEAAARREVEIPIKAVASIELAPLHPPRLAESKRLSDQHLGGIEDRRIT